MDYLQNARGVLLYASHKNVNKELLKGKVNFILASMGEGTTKDESFTTHVQTAYDLNIPCIGVFRCDPEIYGQYTEGLHTELYPQGESDVQMKMLKEQLFCNGKRRIVHAVMVDCSKYVESDGKTIITGNWIKAIGQFIMDQIWKTWKIPVWFFISKEARDSNPSVLDPWIKSLEAISTRTPATHLTGIDGFPLPANDQKPNTYVDGTTWAFWRYGNWTSEAITDVNPVSVPAFIYNGLPSGLYDVLGFKPAEVVDPVVPDTGTGGGPCGTAELAKLSKIELTLDAIKITLDGVFKLLEAYAPWVKK